MSDPNERPPIEILLVHRRQYFRGNARGTEDEELHRFELPAVEAGYLALEAKGCGLELRAFIEAVAGYCFSDPPPLQPIVDEGERYATEEALARLRQRVQRLPAAPELRGPLEVVAGWAVAGILERLQRWDEAEGEETHRPAALEAFETLLRQLARSEYAALAQYLQMAPVRFIPAALEYERLAVPIPAPEPVAVLATGDPDDPSNPDQDPEPPAPASPSRRGLFRKAA